MIKNQLTALISADPERHGGTPCFVGTRVPVQNLFDYLADGDSIEAFLVNFPSVQRTQAVQAVALAADTLLESLPMHGAGS